MRETQIGTCVVEILTVELDASLMCDGYCRTLTPSNRISNGTSTEILHPRHSVRFLLSKLLFSLILQRIQKLSRSSSDFTEMAAAPTTTNRDQTQAVIQALLNGPAVERPSAVEPSLERPQNLNGIVIPVASSASVLVTLAVVLRTYTKLYIIRPVASEDCKSYVPLAFSTTVLTCVRCRSTSMSKACSI